MKIRWLNVLTATIICFFLMVPSSAQEVKPWNPPCPNKFNFPCLSNIPDDPEQQVEVSAGILQHANRLLFGAGLSMNAATEVMKQARQELEKRRLRIEELEAKLKAVQESQPKPAPAAPPKAKRGSYVEA